jgi:hypothetical protein
MSAKSYNIGPEVALPTPNSMNLRDWFAGQALNGYLASWEMNQPAFFNLPHVAQTAYAYADAMIEARKGGER